jgi:hypothetical protein
MAIIYSYPLADEVTNDSWVLGSEMDNGQRVVKNYTAGDLASFARGFVTLNDVLDNNNVSLLDAYIGQLNIFDTESDDYGSLRLNSNVFEVSAASGNTILNIDNGYLTVYQNGGDSATIFFTGSTSRNYELPDADGVIALTDDLLNYVPYTGATGSINIGSNDIYTAGGAKLADDGTVYGAELFLYDSANGDYASLAYSDNIFTLRRPNNVGGSTMINCEDGTFFTLNNGTANATLTNTLTTSRNYTLPDEDGTIALTKYKVYVAIVTQSGSTNPVATVLEDTIKSITITRGGTGQYTINSSGKFTIGKTTFDLTPIQGFIKQGAISNPSAIVFETRDEEGSNSDGLLTAKKLEIRVYN